MFFSKGQIESDTEIDNRIRSMMIDLCERGSVYIHCEDVSLLLYYLNDRNLVEPSSILVEQHPAGDENGIAHMCVVSINQGCVW